MQQQIERNEMNKASVRFLNLNRELVKSNCQIGTQTGIRSQEIMKMAQ